MQFKNLNRFRVGGTAKQMQLAVPLPRTPDGRVYRYSPNKEAHPRHFVLGDAVDVEIGSEARARMKHAPRSNQTVCPYSGVVADDDAFTHPEDRDAALATVKHAMLEDARAAFGKMFDDIANKPGSMFTVEKTRSASAPRPRFARRDLMRELVCDHCGRDYGVFAIALFCPDCGAPNLRLHFQREAELVAAQISLADELPDEQHELAYRLIGNAHEDVLTAFETTLKTVYYYGMAQRPAGSPAFKPVLNDFQNVERAKARYVELGFDPFEKLEDEALEALKLNVQKRHIIGHNLGVVDARFAEHAQDARVGETVRLVGDDVRIFAGLCQAVVDRLDAFLAAGVAAPQADASAPEIGNARMSLPFEPNALAHLGLGAVATRLAVWIAENIENGRAGPIKSDAVAQAFQDVPRSDLDEALAELATDGFVTLTRTMDAGLPRISVTLDLFATFDPVAVGTDPSGDSALLAGFALQIGNGVSAKALHDKTGWSIRRFNPALGLLISQIDDRRVSKSYDDAYPTGYFSLLPEDRVALKRYAARLGHAVQE